MKWKGKKLESMGDVMEAVAAIANQGDKKEADDFLREYLKETPHARSNIGYGAGYYNEQTFYKIIQLFEVSHPVFGKTLPKADEAFSMGLKMGKQMKDRKVRNGKGL
jgi:hypothetical protein